MKSLATAAIVTAVLFTRVVVAQDGV